MPAIFITSMALNSKYRLTEANHQSVRRNCGDFFFEKKSLIDLVPVNRKLFVMNRIDWSMDKNP